MALDETLPAGDSLVSELDDIGQETRIAVNLNTTHRTSNGSDHTYIDQDVTSGSAPTLLGTNFTVIPDSAFSSGATATSAGAGDAGKLVKLDAGGYLDATLLGNSILVTDLDVTGLTVSQLLRVNAGGTAVESSGKTVPAGDIVGSSDSQTLTNKTLTSPVLNTGVSGTAVLDEDDMSSNSATQIATQQSIKAYVDSGTVTMTNKTLTTPTIGDFTNATHDHSDNANGGTLTVLATTGLDLTGLNASQLLRVNSGGTAIESGGASAIVPTGTIVGTSDSQTLTNKVLTSPTITTMLIDDGDAGLTVTSADQTHATPTATIPNITGAADSFVMLALAQTLTNKTISAGTFTGNQGMTNTGGAPGAALTDGIYFYAADIVAGNSAPHFYTEEGEIIKLYQNRSANQAVITPTTTGANTGTSGAGLSLIGDTTAVDQASNIMNDFIALKEDIVALNTLVESLRTALINVNIIKGSA